MDFPKLAFYVFVSIEDWSNSPHSCKLSEIWLFEIVSINLRLPSLRSACHGPLWHIPDRAPGMAELYIFPKVVQNNNTGSYIT